MYQVINLILGINNNDLTSKVDELRDVKYAKIVINVTLITISDSKFSMSSI